MDNVINNGALTPTMILDRAVTMNATPEVIERLLGLQERWEHNQARKAYEESIALARGEIPVIHKNNEVSHGAGRTSYWHEDLPTIAKTVDPVLAKYGLAYRWRTKSLPDNRVEVTCIVSHKLGYFEES